jgi:hypothetical protein
LNESGWSAMVGTVAANVLWELSWRLKSV